MATTTRVLTASVNGTVYTTNANGALEAIDTCHSGATAPTDEVANGKFWLDTTTTPAILKMYNNAAWEEIGGSTSSPTFAGLTVNNQVGIGTSSPSDLLDLSSSDPRIRLTNTGSGYALVRTGGSDASLILEADAGNAAANSDILMRIDGSEKVRIDSLGHVGIGTSSPDSLLAVKGQTVIGNTVAESANLSNLISGTPPQLIAGWSVPAITWTPDSSTEAVFTRDGNMQIDILSGANGFSNVNFSDPDAEDVGQISYDHSTDAMRFRTNNAERMSISSGGDILATGTITATSFVGDGSALTGIAAGGGGITITETVLTAGAAATYVTPTDAFAIEVIVLGGGGGGGGVTGGTNEVAQSGGGGAGGGVKSLIANPDPTYTYTIGAGGGGSSSSTGGTGGTTSFGSLSATGGRGGGRSISSSLSTVAKGGSGGTGTGGDINLTGSRGMSGRCGVNPVGTADGARSLFFNASGGLAAWPTGNGGSAPMWGAGGGGAAIAATSGTRKGGNGAGGVIVIKEYRA